jgi:arsenate reductase
MTGITFFHNPSCSNSRGALALIRERGIEPEVVEYLKAPLGREQLRTLVAAMGFGVRDLLRTKEKIYEELGLNDPKWSDEQLLGFMAAHPILMNRPIVVTPRGTRLCRPPERVLDLLS